MSLTNWKWRLFLFVPVVANTPDRRQAAADVFVDNDSGETEENERRMFSNAARLSVSGNEPAQVLAINTAAKGDMRDGLKLLITGIVQAQWYVIAAVDLPSWGEGELIQSSRASVDGKIGTQFTYADALTDLGLQVIDPLV